MPVEFYILCALPYSVSRRADFHVSVFVSPTIQPDGEDVLGRSRIFADWAATLRDRARFELYDQGGSIECEPLLDAIDPAVWQAAFGPETPVRGPEVPKWQEPNRKWRSFSARNVADAAKSLHLATMYADPTTPPAPSGHPLAADVLRLAGQRPDRRDYDERRLTERFDGLIESRESLATIEDIVAGEQDWLNRIALELHRARRYYERPESQDPYQERPDPGAKPPQAEKRPPEFHERCAMAGDHPALQRKLGLVVDLRVADPDRLRQSSWLGARIDLDGDGSASRATRVRCRVAGDDDLVTVAETAEWLDAALRLGDEELFSVLDVDADGSALKTERFLWTLPRLMAIERNEDPVNAATPAMRASGLTVARTRQALNIQGRLQRQHDLVALTAAGDQPLLSTEDVARGVRVEVWDDTAGRWSSLHRRRIDLDVTGHGKVLDDLEEDGFSQGTAAHETPGVADSPVHVHDAVFGWEGWSLSAPRPGKRIVHADGDEVTEDDAVVADTDLTHPIRISTEVQPGTLPRLRYGRSYAFRAWAVDLAGNSRPHELNPAPLDQVTELLDSILPVATTALPVPDGLRIATNGVLEAHRLTTTELPEGLELLDHPKAGPEILRRLRRRSPEPGTTLADRASTVAAVVAAAVGDPGQPFVTDTTVRTAAGLAGLVSRHAATLAVDAVAALDTVTRPKPFLRWEPVPSPAVVPRHRYSEGESLRTLVIRSGVEQDPDTLAITVTDPAAYAAGTGYRATAERHLAPPKTTQIQAEQYGRFDQAIGSGDATAQQRMLGWAMAEDGTFADVDRADLDDPPNRVPQPGIDLVHNGTLPEAPKTLPLARGETPTSGQYVIHDVDELALPYLPDPLAAGVSVVFAEAGRDRTIAFPYGTEGFTAAYQGDWPAVEPFRLVLGDATELTGEVSGRTVTFGLPPGDLQTFRLASSLRRSELDLFGPWRSMPPAVHDDPDVAEAAADGWMWGLTPYEDVRLVHAVPRPVEAPRPTKLTPDRPGGQTWVRLLGAVDVHGPSTDSVVAEARWTDPVDDLTLPRYEDRPSTAIAFSTKIRPYEDLAVLGYGDTETTLPGVGRIGVHQAKHELGDTKHRVVEYRFRAATRFREYFRSDLVADGNDTVTGPVTRVSVPSSAVPAVPVVHSVLPLFRWSDGSESEQPMARRHTRRAGVRIYLERPWFSSGAGELLGVLLAPTGSDTFGPPPEDQSGYPFVSKWGGDPVWYSRPVQQRALSMLQLDDLLHTSGLDDRHQPGRPVAAPVQLPLTLGPGRPTVLVAGYRPQFNSDRKLWYADIALDPATAFWPFLRLAVCRYQPDSVGDCHLSAPVRCDFVQLPPERTASVSRTDDRHVRVIVTGQVGTREVPGRAPGSLAELIDRNRTVAARLQRRDPEIDTDLGWQTVTTTRLVVRGTGDEPGEVAWVGELDAGTTIPLVRPGTTEESDWRVTIEEWETLPGDTADLGPVLSRFPVWEKRLVYADELAL